MLKALIHFEFQSALGQLVRSSATEQDAMKLNMIGDLCGAIYVDRAFENHVKLFRKYMSSLSKDVEKRFMEKEWESNVKRNFDGSDGPWVVDLPQRPPSSGLKSMFKREKSTMLTLEGYVAPSEIFKQY